MCHYNSIVSRRRRIATLAFDGQKNVTTSSFLHSCEIQQIILQPLCLDLAKTCVIVSYYKQKQTIKIKA